jgi:hypothetical protein
VAEVPLQAITADKESIASESRAFILTTYLRLPKRCGSISYESVLPQNNMRSPSAEMEFVFTDLEQRR